MRKIHFNTIQRPPNSDSGRESRASCFGDWFLPSKDELQAMYDNLHAEGVGGFSLSDYSSSSELSSTLIHIKNFSTGNTINTNKNSPIHVRSVRSFSASVGQYLLRDVGPSGGLIFYIDDTTYYEAAPEDQSTSKAWSNIIDVEIGTTSTEIGTGQANTTAIINQSGGVSDWFLPSKDELNAMYVNLHLEGVGGFIDFYYWSSTEFNSANVWGQGFDYGSQGTNFKDHIQRVRACRSFTATAGSYSLRDTGPGGGLIFYIDGTTYYEAAPSDQSASTWSNIIDVEIGTTSTEIGTGSSNTIAIEEQAGFTDGAAKSTTDYDNTFTFTDGAAKLCNDLSIIN